MQVWNSSWRRGGAATQGQTRQPSFDSVYRRSEEKLQMLQQFLMRNDRKLKPFHFVTSRWTCSCLICTDRTPVIVVLPAEWEYDSPVHLWLSESSVGNWDESVCDYRTQAVLDIGGPPNGRTHTDWLVINKCFLWFFFSRFFSATLFSVWNSSEWFFSWYSCSNIFKDFLHYTVQCSLVCRWMNDLMNGFFICAVPFWSFSYLPSVLLQVSAIIFASM